jgi:RimJ/RimL family protein N-acetyltransferase
VSRRTVRYCVRPARGFAFDRANHEPSGRGQFSSAPPRSEWDAAWMVTLETPRLQLRPWRADDLDDYLQIFSKAPAMAFQMNRGLTGEEAHGFLQFHIDTWEGHPFGHWAVLTKAHGRPIGWVGLESTSSFTGAPDGLQIGWRLDPTTGATATQRRALWLSSGTRSRNSD